MGSTSPSGLELTMAVPGLSSSSGSEGLGCNGGHGNNMRDLDMNQPASGGEEEEFPMGSVEEDEEERGAVASGPHRPKKLRLSKEQSRLMEESFRLHHTLTPVTSHPVGLLPVLTLDAYCTVSIKTGMACIDLTADRISEYYPALAVQLIDSSFVYGFRVQTTFQCWAALSCARVDSENRILVAKQKEALAVKLNLRPRQVEVWFQNRRARTKLKQTELECEYLKRCFGSLTEENRRLQREVEELRAMRVAPPTPLPASALTMCPRCERITAATGAPALRPAAAANPFHPRRPSAAF
ncbi:hypothetical protein HU200_047399 [Digitaria exilis]|uniref:Homeobox domain-containing protein n=1 Tax=Digitaria exilis TaxID=1010633 RepID=A0A835E8K7_9POAL|nr:hypothetical protein HU200_047399 [Digitaria exilis]